eukprot:gene14455-19401_t
MTSLNNSNIAANAKRTSRMRREAKRLTETYDRISAALSSNDPTKAAARNPTRYIPDVPGISGISKVEFKKDAKDIERNSLLMSPLDIPMLDEEMYESVQRSMRPSCNADSFILKKRSRLNHWMNHPEDCVKEIAYWEGLVKSSKLDYETLLLEQNVWNNSFQLTRKTLNSDLKSCVDYNLMLKNQSKMLLTMNEQECGKNIRKRKAMSMKEISDELDSRYDDLVQHVEECEKLSNSISVSLNKSSVNQMKQLPFVMISIDETEAPEDKKCIYFKDKNDFYNKSNKALQNKQINGNPKVTIEPLRLSSTPSVIANKISRTETDDWGFDGTTNESKVDHTSDSSNKPELIKVLCDIEESVRLNQMVMTDLDIFFDDRADYDESHFLVSANMITSSNSQIKLANNGKFNPNTQSIPSFIENQKLSAKPFTDIKTESQWASFLDLTLDQSSQQGLATRKKKKQLESVPLSAYVRHRSEMEVPLVLSVLSCNEDGYLGNISTTDPLLGHKFHTANGNEGGVYNNLIPFEIHEKEEELLTRSNLQSSAAVADLHIRQLKAANIELQKQLNESTLSLSKAQLNYNQTLNEDIIERKRIQKELILYGLSTQDTADVTFSPLVSNTLTTQLVAAAPVNGKQQNSKGGKYATAGNGKKYSARGNNGKVNSIIGVESEINNVEVDKIEEIASNNVIVMDGVDEDDASSVNLSQSNSKSVTGKSVSVTASNGVKKNGNGTNTNTLATVTTTKKRLSTSSANSKR